MSLVSVGLVRPTLIAQIVHKTLAGGSGGADCWLYYFKPADPDRLDFASAFTGNFKANIATFNGITGLDSNLSGLTLTNSPEGARTDASLLVWNKVDLSVNAMAGICDNTFDGVVANYAKDDVWFNVNIGGLPTRLAYDFDGIGTYIVTDNIPLAGECELSGVAAYHADAGRRQLFAGTDGFRVFALGDIGRVRFASDLGSATWNNAITGKADNEEFTYRFDMNTATSSVELFIDDVSKGVRSVTTSGIYINRLSGTELGVNMLDGPHYNIRVCDAFFPVDDGPTGTARNTGVGSDATLINEIVGDWYEAPV